MSVADDEIVRENSQPIEKLVASSGKFGDMYELWKFFVTRMKPVCSSTATLTIKVGFAMAATVYQTMTDMQ